MWFREPLELFAMTGITLDDDALAGNIELKVSSPVGLSAQPCYSVSQSEEGFEKIMQAVTLILEWPVTAGEVFISLAVNPKQNAVPG